MFYPVHWILSLLASILRLGAGQGGQEPVTNEPMSILYEFEGCPWCRIAREAISGAGLAVIVRPCPKGGERFRPNVTAAGGKTQFPYFVDGRTGEGFYESSAVATQMRARFGTHRPILHWLGPLNGVLSSYASLIRFMSGMRVRNSKPQGKPLELHGSEVDPAARLVREMLCELELEYIWRPGVGGGVRLIDPNNGTQKSGGRLSRAYLRDTYAA